MEDTAFAFAAADGAIDNFVVIGGAGPSGEVFAVEDGLEVLAVVFGEDFVGFFGWDFADVDISPADFAAVSLEADGSFEEEGILAIPVVFHDGVIDDVLSVEPDGGAGADLSDTEAIPFAEGFVSADGRVFTGSTSAVIPEPAAAFVGAEFEFGFFGVVPDLDLGGGFEVDAAVCDGFGFVVDQEFVVGKFFVGDEVGAFAVVNEFFVLNGPVFGGIFGPFGDLFLPHFFGHFGEVAGVEVWHAMPAFEVAAVEDGSEAFRGFCGGGSGCEEELSLIHI